MAVTSSTTTSSTWNLLTTPSDILEATRMLFPSADIKKMKDSPLHLQLRLSSARPPILITSSLDRFQFAIELQKIALSCLVPAESAVGNSSHTLDVSRFSVASSPLSGWQLFERAEARYQYDAKLIQDLIKEYLLAAPSTPVPEDLRKIGCDPEQLAKVVDEDTLKIFKEVIQGLPLNHSIIENLRKKYPHITERIAAEIEAEKMAKTGADSFKKIHDQIAGRVIGQVYATGEVSAVLDRTQGDRNSVFLFVGPTGVGKTELAKAIASIRMGHMISFHMNQFIEEHSVSTFFGSPAGYVGSIDKPKLAKELERYPDAIRSNGSRLSFTSSSEIIVTGLVILFDEFEKAHSKLRQSLLTLFDEGYVVMSYTRGSENVSVRYILKKCIIINTSNLCKDLILDGFRRGLPVKEIKDAFKRGNKLLQANQFANSYSDELLGRMEIVPFGPISRGEAYQRLIGIKLDAAMEAMQKEIGCKEVVVENRPEVLARLEGLLYGEGIDIRQIERFFLTMQNVAIRYRGSWGELNKVKISLCPDETVPTKVGLKVLIFSEFANKYVSVPGISNYPIE